MTDYARQRQKAARQAEVRKPPRPPFERVGNACSMCGTSPLPGRRRSWCSEECVDLWYVATRGEAAYRQLLELHGRQCWQCSATWEPGKIGWADRLGQVIGPYDAPFCRIPEYGPPAPRPVSLEVDHVRPLWSLTDEERTELRWWLPFNLQLLCGRCHKAKTKREAGDRARGRLRERLGLGPPAQQLQLV